MHKTSIVNCLKINVLSQDVYKLLSSPDILRGGILYPLSAITRSPSRYKTRLNSKENHSVSSTQKVFSFYSPVHK